MDIGLTLEHQLCFALYSASADLQEAYRESLARLKLTYPQYLAMLVLWEGEPVTTRELAARLRLTPQAASMHMRRLEHRGIVVRRPAGGRDVSWETTEKGMALRGHAAKMQSCMESSIALDDEEVETLRRLALKVLDSSWTITPPPEQR